GSTSTRTRPVVASGPPVTWYVRSYERGSIDTNVNVPASQFGVISAGADTATDARPSSSPSGTVPWRDAAPGTGRPAGTTTWSLTAIGGCGPGTTSISSLPSLRPP